MNKICLISLARKGSKRIHGKNFKDFCGKPLVFYTAKLMEMLKYDSYIMSDYQDLQNYVFNNFDNIKIIAMPDRFGKDKHDVNGSIKYIHEIVNADIYVLLQLTSPIRDYNFIKTWIEDFINNDFETGFSACELDNKYYWDENVNCLNFDQSNRDGNGANKKRIFVENGSFYIFRASAIDKKHVITESRKIYVDLYNVDLDTKEDWKNAEKLYKDLINE